MLIGLKLQQVITGLHSNGIPLSTAINYGILVTGILIAARIISSYVALVATIIFRPAVMPMRLPLLLGEETRCTDVTKKKYI